jgi:hypothetical protein
MEDLNSKPNNPINGTSPVAPTPEPSLKPAGLPGAVTSPSTVAGLNAVNTEAQSRPIAPSYQATVPNTNVTNSTAGASPANDMKQAWHDLDNGSNPSNETGKQGSTNVYSMPKEFQKHNPVAGASFPLGTIVMVVSVVILLLVGSIFLIYAVNPQLFTQLTGITVASDQATQTPVLNNNPSADTTPPSTNEVIATSTATSTSDLVAQDTPKQIYQNYNRELSQATDFSQYYAIISKYGSKYKITQADTDKYLADNSADQGQSILNKIKATTPVIDANVNLEEILAETNATLSITLSDLQSKGVVEFVVEDGHWKLDNETWKLAKQEAATSYSSGVDRDQDGLTDQEEELLGTNKDSTDSDSDGYSDASELQNLYDPAKKMDKLVDNSRIKTYLADDSKFSLIYSSQWQRSSDNNGAKIVFSSTNGHTVTIEMTVNDSEDLDSFYLRTLQLTQIDDALRIKGDAWLGLTTQDGLTSYIMSNNYKNTIYTIYYSTDVSKVLEYKAFYQAMIKSLVIK